MNLRARLRDFLHECRIQRKSRALVAATYAAEPIEHRRELYRDLVQMICERSPEQVLRIERRKGLT